MVAARSWPHGGRGPPVRPDGPAQPSSRTATAGRDRVPHRSWYWHRKPYAPGRAGGAGLSWHDRVAKPQCGDGGPCRRRRSPRSFRARTDYPFRRPDRPRSWAVVFAPGGPPARWWPVPGLSCRSASSGGRPPASSVATQPPPDDVDGMAISLLVHGAGSAERGASIRRLSDLPILDRRAALIAGRTGSVGAETVPVPVRRQRLDRWGWHADQCSPVRPSSAAARAASRRVGTPSFCRTAAT
jgi:hypothetical protein